MGIDDDLAAHITAVTKTVTESSAQIVEIAGCVASCFEQGGKLLICGNGGSAADAQHFAAEFVNHLRFDHDALPAIALTTDTSVLTSIANDRQYEQVFARQVNAIGAPGDVLIAISTSGASPNVFAALAAGRQRGLITIGFTGRGGVERMLPVCDLLLAAASHETERIQECHEFAYHVIAGMVEKRLFGGQVAARTERARMK
jgi:D-sedoheptulose 7-phosphate isomerase